MIFSCPVCFNFSAYILIWNTKQRYASLEKRSTLLDKNLDADEVAGNELRVCVCVSVYELTIIIHQQHDVLQALSET